MILMLDGWLKGSFLGDDMWRWVVSVSRSSFGIWTAASGFAVCVVWESETSAGVWVGHPLCTAAETEKKCVSSAIRCVW